MSRKILAQGQRFRSNLRFQLRRRLPTCDLLDREVVLHVLSFVPQMLLLPRVEDGVLDLLLLLGLLLWGQPLLTHAV